MKKLTVTIAALIMSASMAWGGNLSSPRVDPPVMAPQCTIVFGLLPCNEGGHVRSIPEDETTTVVVTEEHDDCEKPKKDRPRKDKPKGNASANNGKGGNYDKTGHTDNGKGQGRNKK